MSCLIAAISVSFVDRIAIILRFNAVNESVSARSERLMLASCSCCAESAAASLTRVAATSS
jgi:hypothetical protein